MVSIPPLLFALLMWFIGTASDRLARQPAARDVRHQPVLVGALAPGARWWWCGRQAGDASASAAYVGFAAAIVIWGWHEMSFLMGVVAGPNREPCPPDATGWRRFAAATATVIHHELALAATAIMLFALTWGEPNQSAPLTLPAAVRAAGCRPSSTSTSACRT